MAEENVNDVSADAETPTEIEETVVDESPAEPVEEPEAPAPQVGKPGLAYGGQSTIQLDP